MKPKDFARLVARDGGGCVCCGETTAISPNHRANRGMGGASKDSWLNAPSNYVTLCSRMNDLIERDADYARLAISYNWKISKYDDPLTKPVFDKKTALWYYLDNSYNRIEVEGHYEH